MHNYFRFPIAAHHSTVNLAFKRSIATLTDEVKKWEISSEIALIVSLVYCPIIYSQNHHYHFQFYTRQVKATTILETSLPLYRMHWYFFDLQRQYSIVASANLCSSQNVMKCVAMEKYHWIAKMQLIYHPV